MVIGMRTITVAGAFLLSFFMVGSLSFAQAQGDPGTGRQGIQRRAALLKKFDKNGDGKLDKEERAAARAALKARAVERAKAGTTKAPRQKIRAMRQKVQELRGQIKTERGKLQAGNEKVKQRKAQILKKFDKNGDGKLDKEERIHMREALKARRSPRTA